MSVRPVEGESRVSTPLAGRARARLWWRLLLAVPIIGVLWVPSYAHIAPTLLGIPFFYWYLMAWVPASALCSAVVYYKTRDLV
jgi:hypothetical protein